jgi:rhodanese-related sulfurtransferase
MTVKTVNAQTLKTWLDNNQALVVDVREPAEYSAKNIEGSILIPVGQICEAKLPTTDKKIVIHCFGGKRGTTACQKVLAENESAEIYNLEGGISAWEQSGFKVEASGEKVLPLDRQVQITVGSFTLIGTALGYFANPAFLAIPAFFGAGLTFAGLSGTCMLGVMLSKMPWNQASSAGKSCSSAKL